MDRLPSAITERHQEITLGSSVQRKEESMGKVKICFEFVRSGTLQDPDNAAAGCKDLLDGIVKAGLIRDDNPEEIELTVKQSRAKSRKEQGTFIEIEYTGDFEKQSALINRFSDHQQGKRGADGMK